MAGLPSAQDPFAVEGFVPSPAASLAPSTAAESTVLLQFGLFEAGLDLRLGNQAMLPLPPFVSGCLHV